MTTVFLSYARGDDEFFVRRLYDGLTARGFDVWFDRVNMPSRGLTFHQEIRDAIAARDRLLLINGPNAVTSEYVRQEWQYAYFEAEKIITPILRQGDFPLIPDELKLLHCEDFRVDAQYDFHFERLVCKLDEPAPPLGKLIGVPSLPAQYQSRTDRLIPLRDAVRSGLDSSAPLGGGVARRQFHGIVGTSKHVGMHGMGGIGKSVLGNLLAHDRKIREAFPDGIAWVGLGSLPNIVELLRRVHEYFGGNGLFTTESEGRIKLQELLAEKAVLLILDDAWRRADVDAFNVLGRRCRALVTTRDASLLTSLCGTHHLVELLTNEEASRLLAASVGCEVHDLPAQAPALLKECGRLPLAVSLAGGMIQSGMSWVDLLDALRSHELEFISDEHRPEQHQDLWKMIEVSVAALPADIQQRLAELAVFPEDEAVPDAVVTTIWQHTGGYTPRQSRKILVDLKQRSLVQLTRAPDAPTGSVGRVSLHDLIHDHCVRRARQLFGSDAALHERMLEAYRRQFPDGWPNIADDGYVFTHLRDHLVAADRGGELADLLHDLRWLEAKNGAGPVFDLGQDYAAARAALPNSDDRRRILQLLENALRRDLHFIHRHWRDYPQGLFQCLWNTCWWYDCPQAALRYIVPEGGWRVPPAWEQDQTKLYRLLEKWRCEREARYSGFCWLSSRRPPPAHLAREFHAVLRGHELAVASVAWSPDGRRIVSGSWDGTVRVWNAESGAELSVLRVHNHWVISVQFSPDGRRIVSGSLDKTVRVWDTESGAELFVLPGHDGEVRSVAYSPDGCRIVSSTSGNCVCVWDAESGRELVEFRGDERDVASVAYSPDGRKIVTGSCDRTVREWDAETGAELVVLRGHEDKVTSVAYSPDGRWIVSGSWDGTVRVWDVESGAELSVLRVDERAVLSVAYSPDGRRIVSGSWDGTTRVWDAENSLELSVLRGDEGAVFSVAYSPDGRRIVSGSLHKTVQVRDAESGAELSVLRGDQFEVMSVAYSPDGRRIASGSLDATVRVWDAENGAELSTFLGHGSAVKSVAYSPDGRRIVSGSWDGTVRVWDVESGAELSVLRVDERAVLSVAYSPDGRRIVSGSFDKTVRVWDAENGAELSVFRGHEDSVKSVAYSPDGKRIFSGSSDDTVRIWDAESGECVEVIRGRGGRAAIAAGQAVFPYRAISRGAETVIETVPDGRAVAWFSEALSLISTHPAGHGWAGSVESHLYVINLEGHSVAQ
jgi:WD40 repeat protein